MTYVMEQNNMKNYFIDGENVPLETLINHYKKYNNLKNNINTNALNYYHRHREEVLKKKHDRLEKNKYKCECGAIVKCKKSHMKTAKHLKFINKNEE